MSCRFNAWLAYFRRSIYVPVYLKDLSFSSITAVFLEFKGPPVLAFVRVFHGLNNTLNQYSG